MRIEDNYYELVKLAMSGQDVALRQLAEEIQGSLRSYVLRIAFKEDIIDDIVQETILEMFKIFKQLKQADHFWPWLCKIALNKIRLYSREQSRHRELLKGHSEELASRSPDMDGVAAAINEEFKRCIFQAMSVLSERQKAVLSMRCYENMSYAQIAEIIGITELGCRLLFIRAKKKLQNKLFKLGYGQKSLLLALVIFGKLTASSEVTAAQVCVTPAVLSAGSIATGLALVTSKTALTLVVGGVVIAGVATMTGPLSDKTNEPSPITSSVSGLNNLAGSTKHVKEGYYLYPQGKKGPVLTRLIVHEGDNVIQVLQNNAGNYSYNARSQTVTIHNYHYWKSDLSVMTLPTDSTEMESFLAQTEGRLSDSRTLQYDSANLFVVVSGDEERQFLSFGVKNYNALLEERFQYNWPAGAGVEDNRDALHRQGWCCFKIRGQFRGEVLTGIGRIPFVYSMTMDKSAWLKIDIANERTLIDIPSVAAMLDVSGRPVSIYPAGTFLNGLNRPWSGLHVIDTIRRDAAKFYIPFETRMITGGAKGIVTLRLSGENIEYTVDMKKDWIEQIRFIDSANMTVGEIIFDYLRLGEFDSAQFKIPQLSPDANSQESQELHWLSSLVADRLLSR